MVALSGELGAGKTTLTKGIAQGLGVSGKEYVTSPSFIIAREYKGKFPVYHIDLFRLDAKQLETTGFEEYIGRDGVCIIEWAEKAAFALPSEYLKIKLAVKGEKERELKVFGVGQRYKKLLC